MRDVAGKGTLSDANMEDMLKEVRLALLEADVNYRIVKQFLDEIREKARGEDVLNSVEPGQQLVKIVHDQIIELLGSEDAEIHFKEEGITTIMMVGLQGTGKTTSAAKIAKIFKEKNSRKVLMIAADVIRPAAIEQLQTLGNEIGVDVYSLGVEKSAKETVGRGMIHARENGYDTVIIDTAGRLHIDEELMDELRVINVNVEPDEILLTVDAMTGQDIVNVARAFAEALPLTGLVVTKFDGDSRGGGVLSVKKITGVPVKFVGEGEKIDDMSVFHPDRMADRILGMGDVVSLVERAQMQFDEEEAKKLEKKIRKNKFDFDDFMGQIQQIKKMGNIKDLAAMIPGVGKQIKDLDIDDDAFKGIEAIINSMTPKERANPDIINQSRRKRIAAGSGTKLEDVNRLMKQFDQTRKVMRMVTGMGSSKMAQMANAMKAMKGGGMPKF